MQKFSEGDVVTVRAKVQRMQDDEVDIVLDTHYDIAPLTVLPSDLTLAERPFKVGDKVTWGVRGPKKKGLFYQLVTEGSPLAIVIRADGDQANADDNIIVAIKDLRLAE